MSVWFACPSARPIEQVQPVVDKWRRQGYQVALWRDSEANSNPHCDVLMFPSAGDSYPGYAKACNELVRFILEHDPSAEWIVCAGDDTDPDLNHTASEVAGECADHFNGTFGVMQPTGDRWGDNQPPLKGAYIDRICGSSWYGREFCERINGGRGLFHPEYFHMYVDEEMLEVAKKLGVLWQRRDLIHYHDHWGRKHGFADDMPSFLKKANSAEAWREAKQLFETRKAAGFPGHEPLEAKP